MAAMWVFAHHEHHTQFRDALQRRRHLLEEAGGFLPAVAVGGE
jgi:hypothetical protein